jgi:hypothetical protein
MALVVETGSGLSNAEAYASEAFADAYVAAYVTGALATAWLAADSANKEVALRRGAQYLDGEYGGMWNGDRYDADQALDWPRSNFYLDDRLQTATTLPNALLQANVELAIRALSDNSLVDDVTAGGSIAEYEVKVDTITERTKYIGGSNQQKQYSIIEQLVSKLIGGGRIIRS